MGKVVIKILQGSAGTKNVLRGLIIGYIYTIQLQISHNVPKNYESWLAIDEVIATIRRLCFFGPPFTRRGHNDELCSLKEAELFDIYNVMTSRRPVL